MYKIHHVVNTFKSPSFTRLSHSCIHLDFDWKYCCAQRNLPLQNACETIDFMLCWLSEVPCTCNICSSISKKGKSSTNKQRQLIKNPTGWFNLVNSQKLCTRIAQIHFIEAEWPVGFRCGLIVDDGTVWTRTVDCWKAKANVFC